MKTHKKLVSSKSWPAKRSFGGIFSRDENQSPLHDANKVYLPYCSSDGHMGMVGSEDKAEKLWGLYFRGADIVQSMMKALVKDYGLGDRADDQVVFGGYSAGGRGAMVNIDKIVDIPEALGKHPIKVLGALDSPLYMNIEPLNSGTTGLKNMMRGAYANFNVKSVVPQDCASRHAGKEWRCIFGQFRLEFIKTPFVLFADQFDSY